MTKPRPQSSASSSRSFPPASTPNGPPGSMAGGATRTGSIRRRFASSKTPRQCSRARTIGRPTYIGRRAPTRRTAMFRVRQRACAWSTRITAARITGAWPRGICAVPACCRTVTQSVPPRLRPPPCRRCSPPKAPSGNCSPAGCSTMRSTSCAMHSVRGGPRR